MLLRRADAYAQVGARSGGWRAPRATAAAATRVGGGGEGRGAGSLAAKQARLLRRRVRVAGWRPAHANPPPRPVDGSGSSRRGIPGKLPGSSGGGRQGVRGFGGAWSRGRACVCVRVCACACVRVTLASSHTFYPPSPPPPLPPHTQVDELRAAVSALAAARAGVATSTTALRTLRSTYAPVPYPTDFGAALGAGRRFVGVRVGWVGEQVLWWGGGGGCVAPMLSSLSHRRPLATTHPPTPAQPLRPACSGTAFDPGSDPLCREFEAAVRGEEGAREAGGGGAGGLVGGLVGGKWMVAAWSQCQVRAQPAPEHARPPPQHIHTHHPPPPLQRSGCGGGARR